LKFSRLYNDSGSLLRNIRGANNYRNLLKKLRSVTLRNAFQRASC